MSTLVSTNPSRNFEPLGEVEMTSRDEVIKTVERARTAQSSWGALPLEDRCAAVTSFIEVAKSRVEEIAVAIAEETGRPLASSRLNVSGGIEYFQEYVSMATDALAPKITFETESEIHRVYREPWGVIAAICPWNYPFANIVWQCGQAILAGNTIVYKNSEENPLFAQLIEDLVSRSDLPKNVLNVIYGDGEVGSWLARSDIDMISFTGSTQTGHILTQVAAEKFIPIVSELGGSSPCIITEGVEITDDVVNFIFNSRFLHSGQICSGIKRLIVHDSTFDVVVEKLVALASTKKVGDALDETVDLGPLVADRQLITLEQQVKDATDKGAKIECGGRRPEGLKGAYYVPTILTDITKDMKVWHEEVFGPVLPIVSYQTEEEAISLANDTQYGLGAHVFTDDSQVFRRFAHRLQSGMVAQNRVIYFNPKNPFGGYKRSGMGRIHGQFGFDEVTQIKLVSEEK